MSADPTVRVVEMAAHSTVSHDELFAIGRRMKQDGLNPACNDEQKIGYIWRIYQQSEESLKSAIGSVDELQEQQMEEMKEVETYVEHIRSLSHERETLTLEFEAENETLKAEADELRKQLEGYASNESREMLEQQGLHDIVSSSTTEQIAYLLVERARLLDELEAEQTEAGTLFQTPEGSFSAAQLWAILSQERRDLEKHDAERKRVRQNLKDDAEEEIAVLMSENARQQEALDVSKRKISDLMAEVDDWEAKLDDTRRALNKERSNRIPAQPQNDSEEMRNVTKRVSDLEAENQLLSDNVEMLHKDFGKDKSIALEKIREQEMVIRKVTKESDEKQGQLKAVNRALEQSKMDSETLEDQLSHVQRLLKLKKGEVAEPEEGDRGQLEWETKKLRKENVRLMGELDGVQSEAATERATRREAEGRARTAETEARDLKEEKQRELNLHTAKVTALESKIEILESEVTNSQKEKWLLKNEHRKDLLQRQTSAQEDLEELRSELKSLKQTKRSLELKLSEHEDNLVGLQQRVNKETERGRRLEADKAQLQVQVEELSIKLSVTSQSLTEKEQALLTKQRHFEDEIDARELSLADAVRLLDEHKENNKRINEKLVSKEVEVEERLQSMDRVKMTTEERLMSVKEELTKVRLSHQDHVNQLNRELDQLQAANKQLQQKIENKESELAGLISRLEGVTDDAKSSRSQLEQHLESEMNRRSELEGRNKVLEDDTAKAWSKLQDILEKMSRLESDNDLLKAELQRKSASSKDIEEMFSKRDGDRESRLKVEMLRAETAEKKMHELQSELDRTQTRLQAAEDQLPQLNPLRDELQTKQTELARFKAELKSEIKQRTAFAKTSEELQTQISAMRDKEQQLQQRNNELQHLLLDVQNKMDNMKDRASTAASLRNENEANQKNVAEHVLVLQKEVENLHVQLITAADKYDLQCRRYAERKIRTKDQLNKAREVFLSEKSQLKFELEKIQNELIICKATLTKEQEALLHVEKDHRTLLAEKRDLLSELSEKEETQSDQKRLLSVLQVRANYLEEENTALQQRVDSLVRQKHNLDNVVKDYQLKSHSQMLAPNPRGLLTPRFLDHLARSSNVSLAGSSNHSDTDFDGDIDLAGADYLDPNP